MKRKYSWMNDGKEFSITPFVEKGPLEQRRIIELRIRAKRKYADLRPTGIEPKDVDVADAVEPRENDMTEEWDDYRMLYTMKTNFDLMEYELRKIDPNINQEIMDKNLNADDIGNFIEEYFRQGKTPKQKKEN